MRGQVARFGGSLSAVVERCAGRTHIEDRPLPRLWISHGDFLDEGGFLAEAGSVNATDAASQTTRFHMSLPIHLEAYATERPDDASGWITRRVPDQDLSRAPDDLCLFARGATHLHGVWRSNTVIIPYDAIRAALAPASGPAPR